MVGGPKVLHINTYDQGGAANACVRLHTTLLESGFQSNLLVKFGSKAHKGLHPFRKTNFFLDKVESRTKKLLHILNLRKHADLGTRELERIKFKNNLPTGIEYFSFPESDTDITTNALYEDADIIHLHWVSGFLDYGSFFKKNKKPIIWTLHDMEPFQGGHHYEEKFFGVDEYGKPVPFIIPEHIRKIVKKNLDVKKEALSGVTNLTVVAPSRWLKKSSEESSLFNRFPHFHIPYGLDSNVYKPRNKVFGKELFNLPVEKPCILFVSDKIETFRKGFDFLREALGGLNATDFILCAVGSNSINLHGENIRLVGRIEDERLMSVLFSAADVFVIPSLEDNLPNTVLESLLCGTPVIGFPSGGIPDMVIDRVNGYLCPEISVDALRLALREFLDNDRAFSSHDIRQHTVAKYCKRIQAKAYSDLYVKVYQSATS